MYLALSESPLSVLIYIRANALTELQWCDVVSIIKFGVPYRTTEKLSKFSFKATDIESFWVKRIKFCLSFPTNAEAFPAYTSKYQTIVSHSIVRSVENLSISSLEDIVAYSAPTSKLIDKSKISAFISWLYEDMSLFLRTEYEKYEGLIYLNSISIAIDFFTKSFEETDNHNVDRISKITSAIDKIDESFKSINVIQIVYDTFTEVFNQLH